MNASKSAQASNATHKQHPDNSADSKSTKTGSAQNENWQRLASIKPKVASQLPAVQNNDLFVQMKLSVGSQNDSFEKQADEVANKAMALSDSQLNAPRTYQSEAPQTPSIQRMKGLNTSGAGTTAVSPNVIKAIQSPGKGTALSSNIKSRVEHVTGANLSHVRVHQNEVAQEAALDLNAKAFTHKNHIYLGPGQGTTDAHLLAHEAAHTVQQTQSNTPHIQRFEARYHESAERVGLSAGAGGLSQSEITQIYIGNWMRDINQAFVPTMQAAIPHQIRFELIKYMGIKKFGQSFSAEQLGYYIPAEHLDNPAGLLQNGRFTGDTLQAQPALNSGERTDAIPDSGMGSLATPQDSVHPTAQVSNDIAANIFSVDQTGVMAFMRRSNLHIERRLTLAALRGRKEEGLMHLGAALHTIEDLFAHSNWIEIAASKVLADNPDLLATELSSDERDIFRYSGTLQAGMYAQGMVTEDRPILTTGSFVSLDTAVSISHELTGFLRKGLHAEANPSVANAQKQLLIALLGQYGGDNAAAFVATLQAVPFPAIPASVLNQIYSLVNPNLAAIADQMEANMAEQKISETNLMAARDANTDAASGKFSSIAEQTMALQERFGAPSVEQQRILKAAEAKEREASFAQTPTDVMASPSHSQIAKDHSNSIFFGIAFRLATIAVRMMREKMTQVWDASGQNRAYQRPEPAPAHRNEAGYPWQEGYVAPWLRGQGSSPRTSRDFAAGLRRTEAESLETGNDIIEHGHARGQEYDLAEMRGSSADKIQTAGANLEVAGRYALMIASTRAIGVVLKGIAERLATISETVRNAQTYDERSLANQQLTAEQALLAEQIILFNETGAASMNVTATIMGSVMTLLNREVATTSVAYTPAQQALQASGTSDLQMNEIDLGEPDVSMFSDNNVQEKVRALLIQSRIILGHPYDNLWWYEAVYDYVNENASQFAEEVRARNAGYAGFRHGGGGHSR